MKPSKVKITMGETITKTHYHGKVSPVQILNAVVVLMKDAQEMSGMQYKEMFAILDNALDAKVFKKNPTMRASESEAGDDTEEH